MIRRMPCNERQRLLRLYSDATAKLSSLCSSLSEVAVSPELDTFRRAWEHCEDARQLCADIRQQIYSHLEEHRCGLEI